MVALRGVRRLRDLWRRLQVREDDQDTLVVLNQASRKREVQPDLARKVVGGRLAETTIPADFAAFEAAVNTGSPARLEDQKLRGAFEALAAELEALPGADEAAPRRRRAARPARPPGRRARPDHGRVRGPAAAARRDRARLWQIGLVGYTYMLAGHAAREGARELATDTTDDAKTGPSPYADAARARTCRRRGARARRSTRPATRTRSVARARELEVPVVIPGSRSGIKITSERRHRDRGRGRCRRPSSYADPDARRDERT